MHKPVSNAATRRLGIAAPIVQGPFGGGLSTVELASTVSNLGGLGSYGAHQLDGAAIGRIAADLRTQTPRPFALNLWIPLGDVDAMQVRQDAFDRAWLLFAPYFAELGLDRPELPQRYVPDYAEQIDALLAASPPVFSFVFGAPSTAVLAECRRRDIVTIGAATSIAEAQFLEAAGVDLIVATGCEAGGHRPSFLAPPDQSLIGTLVLTQLLSRRVSKPLIAAGGIVDARGIRAAFALGAHAAQLGTAFLATNQSGAHAAHREQLFSERAQHTELTRGFSGRLARGISNTWTQRMRAPPVALADYPVQNWFAAQLRPAAVAAGRTDLVSLWSGQIAPNLQHRSADALMRHLLDDLAAEPPTSVA